MTNTLTLPIDIDSVKGFLAPDEGAALHRYTKQCAALGPALEIGSYCGKSTVYIGAAAKEVGSIVYAVDHHRGSEEHQLGEEYHDADLYDSASEQMDTFREFRRTIRRADLDAQVVPIVAPSMVAAQHWSTPLGFVFIDGGHSMEAAQCDYRAWASHVKPGGILAIHDIFPNPDEGGQAPYTIYKQAVASGLYEAMPMVNTLGLLRRLAI